MEEPRAVGLLKNTKAATKRGFGKRKSRGERGFSW
jgi:hypothetical protein